MLFKILEIRLKSPILVNILKALYTGTTAAIKGSKSFFKTFSGCRQGGIESPVIFNIFLDFVLRCAKMRYYKSYETPDCSTRFKFMVTAPHVNNRIILFYMLMILSFAEIVNI